MAPATAVPTTSPSELPRQPSQAARLRAQDDDGQLGLELGP